MIFSRLSILIAFTLLFCSDVVDPDEELKKYQPIPSVGDKELVYLNGDPLKFSDLYKDGPVLLSFWFLGCGPCVAEMKHLSKINTKYKDDSFKIISVNTDTRNKGKVKSFVKKKKYSFDMLFDLNGKNGLIKKLGGLSCPYTVLINSDGTIYSKHLGYERGDEIALEKEIAELVTYNKTISVTEDTPEEKLIEKE
jgi:thiol-disulfide isomerase/thioredoxin